MQEELVHIKALKKENEGEGDGEKERDITEERERDLVRAATVAVIARLQKVPGMPSDLNSHIVHSHTRAPIQWSQVRKLTIIGISISISESHSTFNL